MVGQRGRASKANDPTVASPSALADRLRKRRVRVKSQAPGGYLYARVDVVPTGLEFSHMRGFRVLRPVLGARI
jgi:hypothetical protein